MFHTLLFAGYDEQAADRGASEAMSVGWLMGMARRRFENSSLTARVMLGPSHGAPATATAAIRCCSRPARPSKGSRCETGSTRTTSSWRWRRCLEEARCERPETTERIAARNASVKEK
jgi:hypothetical protein